MQIHVFITLDDSQDIWIWIRSHFTASLLGDSWADTVHPSGPHLSASHFGLCLCRVGCSDGTGLHVLLPQVLPISFVTWGQGNCLSQVAVLGGHWGDLTSSFWRHTGRLSVLWGPLEVQSVPSGRMASFRSCASCYSCPTFRRLCLDHVVFPPTAPYWRLQEVASPPKSQIFFPCKAGAQWG